MITIVLITVKIILINVRRHMYQLKHVKIVLAVTARNGGLGPFACREVVVTRRLRT